MTIPQNRSVKISTQSTTLIKSLLSPFAVTVNVPQQNNKGCCPDVNTIKPLLVSGRYDKPEIFYESISSLIPEMHVSRIYFQTI